MSFDVLTRELERLPLTSGSRLLQVGGSAGMALRYAHDVLGWYSAERHQGSSSSDRRQPLFDVCVDLLTGAEIGEVAFRARHARSLLRASGHFVLVVGDSTVEESILSAPASDDHRRITALSASALADLPLRMNELGFAHTRVVRDGAIVILVCSRQSSEGNLSDRADITPDARAEFLAGLASDERMPEGLRLVFAVKHFRDVVDLGRGTLEMERVLLDWLRDSRQVDLNHPRALDMMRLSVSPIAGLVAQVAFSAGMMRVVRRFDWGKAVELFAVAEELVASQGRSGHALDHHQTMIRDGSPPHRLLCMIHTDAATAIEEWKRRYEAGGLQERSFWTVRLFVEAFNAGHGSAFVSELEIVSLSVAELATLEGQRNAAAAADGAYVMARSALALNDPWCANQWVSIAEQILDTARDVLDDSWYRSARTLTEQVRSETRLSRSLGLLSPVPLPSADHEAKAWEIAPQASVSGRVSVVIAYFRGEKYLSRALASIAHQTCQPLEVIIVDDGSPNGVPHGLSDLNFPFTVRVLSQGNAGQSAARNRGIRAARGEFIAFLDQDDEWKPDHLATLLPLLASDETCAWVYADFETIDGAGNKIERSYLRDKGISLDRFTVTELVASDIMALPSASIVRRSALMNVRGFDRRLSGYEDDELFFRLKLAGWNLTFASANTIRYRVHEANSSASTSFQRSRLIFLMIMAKNLIGEEGQIHLSLLGERLLKATLSDYLRLLTVRDDRRARTAARTVRMIGEYTGTGLGYSALTLSLLERPQLMRVVFAVVGRLPSRLRRLLISEGVLRNYRRVQREAQLRRVNGLAL